MKPSIKFKSIGGATITSYGSALAGDFNVPLDLIGAFDPSYGKTGGADAAFCILLKGETSNKFDTGGAAFTAMYIYISGVPTATGSYNSTGVSAAIARAISNHNGTGESIVSLPEGINCLGWEYKDILY